MMRVHALAFEVFLCLNVSKQWCNLCKIELLPISLAGLANKQQP